MTVTDGFASHRKTPTGGKREPEYWCLNCTVPRWRGGGASELGRHQTVHGAAEAFPRFELIDAEGYVLDFEGIRLKVDRQLVRASTEVTGWVRSRLLVMGPLAHDREASR